VVNKPLKKKKAKKRALAPKGGDERVYTPPELAAQIVAHFRPSGRLLEPCAGRGAFVQAMKAETSLLGSVRWCEIDVGVDFFDWVDPVDWIVTNPPWGAKFRSFLLHSMTTANNIVFLANMNVWDTKCRRREIAEAGFGVVEILTVDTPARRHLAQARLDELNAYSLTFMKDITQGKEEQALVPSAPEIRVDEVIKPKGRSQREMEDDPNTLTERKLLDMCHRFWGGMGVRSRR